MSAPAALRRAAGRSDYQRVPRRNGKPVLRRSFVQAFLGCPVYAASTSTEARLGIYHHDNFAAYTLECKRQREDSLLSEVDRIARETFFTYPRGLDPSYVEDGRQLLDRFARMYPSEWETLTRVEDTLVVDVGWAYLTGTIDREDRLDGGDPDDPPTEIRIRDYKSWWGRDTHEFQARFYAALRYQQPDADELQYVEMEFIYPRRNMEPVASAWTRDDWENGELGEWWQEEVLEPLARWWPQRRRLGAHGGAQCVYCAKRFTCAAADLGASQVPADEQEVAEHFQVTLRLEQLMAERRQQLAKFFERRPPMEIAGYELGYLFPNTKPKRAITPGEDEHVIELMNAIMPGAGDLVRRDGVNPDLLSRDWWDKLVADGLATEEPQDPKFKWRKAPKQKRPELSVVDGDANGGTTDGP